MLLKVALFSLCPGHAGSSLKIHGTLNFSEMLNFISLSSGCSLGRMPVAWPSQRLLAGLSSHSASTFYCYSLHFILLAIFGCSYIFHTFLLDLLQAHSLNSGFLSMLYFERKGVFPSYTSRYNHPYKIKKPRCIVFQLGFLSDVSDGSLKMPDLDWHLHGLVNDP